MKKNGEVHILKQLKYSEKTERQLDYPEIIQRVGENGIILAVILVKRNKLMKGGENIWTLDG